MKTKFIQQLASDILALTIEQQQNQIIVMPSRRGGVFLQKHLRKMSVSSMWMPKIYSIEDFVFEYSGFEKANTTDLILDLYDTILSLDEPTGQIDFEDFAGFGPTLLRDFNDIDSYLADAKVVFTYLKEARELQKWNPENPLTGEKQKNFLKFYQNLWIYYQKFIQRSISAKKAYYGLALRQLVEKLNLSKLNGRRFIFAGFHALTKAEYALFEMISKEAHSKIYVDADNYYLNDPKKEPYNHLQDLIKHPHLDIVVIQSDGFREGKKIRITGTSGEISQVKQAAAIIENWKNENVDEDEIAVVLPNEELLFSLLNSIPSNIDKLNISMSYPIRKTASYDLIIQFFAIFETAERFQNKAQNREKIFHYKSVFAFLDNSLIKRFFQPTNESFKRNVLEENISQFSHKSLYDLALPHINADTFHPLWVVWDTRLENRAILGAAKVLLENLLQRIPANTIDYYIVSDIYQIINQLIEKLTTYKFSESAGILRKIFQTISYQTGLNFSGEPLQGVQIMGFLETRSLDFERMVYLSFNEGQLPAVTGFRSYILPEIRHYFGLPQPGEEERIAAYHFYRSVQRAKEVELIYNTIPGNLGGGEMSRYGLQLLYHAKHSTYAIQHQITELQAPNLTPVVSKEIKKDENIYGKLLQIATEEGKGFSPSSLSVWLRCPLQFYFSKITGISAPDEMEEEMALNTRGSALHKALEVLYKKEADTAKNFDENFFQNALESALNELNSAYLETYKKGDIEHGYNLILRKLDEKMILNFLQKDTQFSLHTSEVKCEEDLEFFLPIFIEGKEYKIKFRGQADRIDLHQNIRRIIDYKTGKMDKPKEFFINPAGQNDELWEKIFIEGKSQKVFQLLIYSWLYWKNHPEEKQILPIIAALRQNEVFYPLQTSEGLIDYKILQEFEYQLVTLISEILDPKKPISQTTNQDFCRYCDFKQVCRR
ncbi:MAG: PD-(D/E)XK nuclease family protein [Bacteroidales bacterium]|nr:PD-(D/E)XK nuclease family protein [Bacteroidales bacterium]